MKEKRSTGKRIVLSIIAIAVIVAIVTISIVAAVMAEEAHEDTHPVQSTETQDENSKAAPDENSEAMPEQGTSGNITENTAASGQQSEADIREQEPTPERTVGSENVNADSTLLHYRQRPGISREYKQLPDLKSKYAVVMDADTNTLIAGKQAGIRMFPASLTKVMTLLTAVDFLPTMDRTFSITLEESDAFYRENASVAGLLPGEPAKASDMLYGLILPSGADCALGLANVTAGNMETFTKLMNLEGAKMGLKDSHFSNTSGLHDENNYTTAYDLAVIFRYALDNELCKKVLGTPSYTTEKTGEHPEGIPLWSHTFSYMTGVDMAGFEVIAGKTGFTTEAGACMVTAAKRDNRTIIVVTGFAPNSRDMCADHIEVYKGIAEGRI